MGQAAGCPTFRGFRNVGFHMLTLLGFEAAQSRLFPEPDFTASFIRVWKGGWPGLSRHLRRPGHFASLSNSHRVMGVRTPQVAASAIVKRKTSPTSRPDGVFVLQAWSTAISQTTNRISATVARAFNHITFISANGSSVPPPRVPPEVPGSQQGVISPLRSGWPGAPFKLRLGGDFPRELCLHSPEN